MSKYTSPVWQAVYTLIDLLSHGLVWYAIVGLAIWNWSIPAWSNTTRIVWIAITLTAQALGSWGRQQKIKERNK